MENLENKIQEIKKEIFERSVSFRKILDIQNKIISRHRENVYGFLKEYGKDINYLEKKIEKLEDEIYKLQYFVYLSSLIGGSLIFFILLKIFF